MKKVSVHIKLPDLPVPRAEQHAAAEGPTVLAALKRALTDVLGRPGVSRRRFSSMEISVAVFDVQPDPTEFKEP